MSIISKKKGRLTDANRLNYADFGFASLFCKYSDYFLNCK